MNQINYMLYWLTGA